MFYVLLTDKPVSQCETGLSVVRKCHFHGAKAALSLYDFHTADYQCLAIASFSQPHKDRKHDVQASRPACPNLPLPKAVGAERTENRKGLPLSFHDRRNINLSSNEYLPTATRSGLPGDIIYSRLYAGTAHEKPYPEQSAAALQVQQVDGSAEVAFVALRVPHGRCRNRHGMIAHFQLVGNVQTDVVDAGRLSVERSVAAIFRIEGERSGNGRSNDKVLVLIDLIRCLHEGRIEILLVQAPRSRPARMVDQERVSGNFSPKL